MITKVCTRCSKELNLDKFFNSKKGRFGKKSICKICSKNEQRIRNSNPIVRKKLNELHKKYRIENKEKYNQYDKNFREYYHKSLDGYSSRLFSGAKSRAIKKDLDFNLTSQWVKDKVSLLICEATGFELNIKSGQNCKTNPLQPTLDRINPKKGYTIDNTRVTCWWWNVMKQDWDDEIIINLINQYKNDRK